MLFIFCALTFMLTLIIFVYYKFFRKKYHHKDVPFILRDFTIKQLREFDGTKGKPIYIAVNGKIFDVSHRCDYYGHNGPYGIFAGRDATKGLAKFDLSHITDIQADLSDLTTREMESVKEWELQFSDKYNCMGRLINENEEPSDYSSLIYETLNLYNNKDLNPAIQIHEAAEETTATSHYPHILLNTFKPSNLDENDDMKGPKITPLPKSFDLLGRPVTFRSKLNPDDQFEAKFEPLFKSRSISSITEYFNLPLNLTSKINNNLVDPVAASKDGQYSFGDDTAGAILRESFPAETTLRQRFNIIKLPKSDDGGLPLPETTSKSTPCKDGGSSNECDITNKERISMPENCEKCIFNHNKYHSSTETEASIDPLGGDRQSLSCGTDPLLPPKIYSPPPSSVFHSDSLPSPFYGGDHLNQTYSPKMVSFDIENDTKQS